MKHKIPLLLLAFFLAACNESSTAQPGEPPAAEAPSMAAEQPTNSEDAEVPVEAADAAPVMAEDTGILPLDEAWKGDLDGMKERRVIRVLTVYGLGRYWLDGAAERGITYEMFKLFEKSINKKFRTRTLKLHVVFIPVARHELIPGLLEGRGDIAVAGLTITPERMELVDFTEPVSRELSEVLVTGPSAPPLESIDDLAGQTVYVRESSSYRSSIDTLNGWFREDGLDEIVVRDASEYLEDEDLLEMVNSGLLDWAVVDDYKAGIWSDVFDGLTVRDDIVFRMGGRLGWAVRKNSPQLLAALNEFLKSHRQGTLTGNVLINRYLRDFDWASNALSDTDFSRFESVVGIFTRYGEAYGVDYLIAAAQGYQESRLDQSVRSRAGAVGIMQLLPSTAADPNVGIPDISSEEPNIHAGVKYLDFIRTRYFSDPAIDDFNRTLLALAAYNAGPAAINRVRGQAEKAGYDPNQWFDNVEVMAAKKIGSEPVKYVSNILKYYVAYRLSTQQEMQRAQARERVGIDSGR